MGSPEIIGPWKLLLMEATDPEGEVFYPFGENPSGMIMYDSSGYMSYTSYVRLLDDGLIRNCQWTQWTTQAIPLTREPGEQKVIE